ncbi:hypothetical protein MBLNU459_g7674t1 [Dothideomycetes sp. NU459]
MRVLISGAGIAGSTLAWFLARAGVHITIVEKAHSIPPHGQNIDIQGSAVKIAKKMGLLDQIRQANTTEKGTQFIDPNGKPFALFSIIDGCYASPTSEFEILRGDLAAILYRAAKDDSNVDYLFGTTITEVISNDNDKVEVRLSDGKIHEFDLLVAADGQWSQLRKQCFPTESVKVIHKRMYACYWTVPRLSRDNDLWNVYLALGSRIISTRPDPYGTIRTMFSHMPCNDAQEQAWMAATRSDRKTQQELVKREFADAGWESQRLLDSMDQAPDFYLQPIQQIKMTKWSNARVICLGDTAYAPTPLSGMGAALAMIGGYVLAGELSKLKDGDHPSTALEAYESIFRPFVEESQEIPSFVPAIAHPATAWKRWMFQAFVGTLAWVLAIPWVRNKFGEDSMDDNFSLPQYSGFVEEGTE